MIENQKILDLPILAACQSVTSAMLPCDINGTPDIWSCPWYSLENNLGYPRLFPTWCTSFPGPRCPICPRTTWDFQGCSRHGVWEHHQSQVRDVPSAFTKILVLCLCCICSHCSERICPVQLAWSEGTLTRNLPLPSSSIQQCLGPS